MGYIAVASPIDGSAVRYIVSRPGLNINHQNNYGNTTLWYAAHLKSHFKVFETLLKAGADPNITNQFGENVMTRHLKGKKDSQVVRLLLRYQFDVKMLTSDEVLRIAREIAEE